MRLLEHYTSVQGEGPNVGRLTQFVRFAGCNMRCEGWPCDTPQAIYPDQWQKLATSLPPEVIYMNCVDMASETGAHNICLTGGEPFMQPKHELEILVGNLKDHGYTVECFTNGSFAFPEWAVHNIRFMMDWKLRGSGESQTKRGTRSQNALRLTPADGIKFVCKDEADMQEARSASAELIDLGCYAQFWIGSAWGLPERDVVQFMIDHHLDWRLNVQVHKFIWDPEATGV